MIPSVFGVAIFGIAMVMLLSARAPTMFVLVMVCALMAGSAAVTLTALGNSSIPPTHFALVFLLARLFLPGSGQRALIGEGIRANMLLIIFVGYGVVMAFVGPRLFAGMIGVVPMRPTQRYIYATDPLMFRPQNITTAVYLMGTALAAVAAYVIARQPRGPLLIVRTGVVIAWIHIFLGVSGVLLRGTVWDDILDFFRNGSYTQTDQTIGTLVRMKGIMPESAVYAVFGVGWFLFLFECWYRDVLPGRTGPVALVLGTTLLASTSSTAYVGLGGYATILIVRMLALPMGIDSGKLIRMVLALLVMTVLVSLVFMLRPSLAGQFGDMIVAMTVGKQDSTSGLQRAFWAKQGLAAFGVSWGLGIGPGSFRSSSIATAIVGSSGVVGSIAFGAYLIHVLKPLRASTFGRVEDEGARIGVSASWAAVCMLIPAMVASPTTDPGTDFAMMAGLALALRRGPAGAVARHSRAGRSTNALPARHPIMESGPHGAGQTMEACP